MAVSDNDREWLVQIISWRGTPSSFIAPSQAAFKVLEHWVKHELPSDVSNRSDLQRTRQERWSTVVTYRHVDKERDGLVRALEALSGRSATELEREWLGNMLTPTSVDFSLQPPTKGAGLALTEWINREDISSELRSHHVVKDRGERFVQRGALWAERDNLIDDLQAFEGRAVENQEYSWLSRVADFGAQFDEHTSPTPAALAAVERWKERGPAKGVTSIMDSTSFNTRLRTVIWAGALMTQRQLIVELLETAEERPASNDEATWLREIISMSMPVSSFVITPPTDAAAKAYEQWWTTDFPPIAEGAAWAQDRVAVWRQYGEQRAVTNSLSDAVAYLVEALEGVEPSPDEINWLRRMVDVRTDISEDPPSLEAETAYERYMEHPLALILQQWRETFESRRAVFKSRQAVRQQGDIAVAMLDEMLQGSTSVQDRDQQNQWLRNMVDFRTDIGTHGPSLEAAMAFERWAQMPLPSGLRGDYLRDWTDVRELRLVPCQERRILSDQEAAVTSDLRDHGHEVNDAEKNWLGRFFRSLSAAQCGTPPSRVVGDAVERWLAHPPLEMWIKKADWVEECRDEWNSRQVEREAGFLLTDFTDQYGDAFAATSPDRHWLERMVFLNNDLPLKGCIAPSSNAARIFEEFMGTSLVGLDGKPSILEDARRARLKAFRVAPVMQREYDRIHHLFDADSFATGGWLGNVMWNEEGYRPLQAVSPKAYVEFARWMATPPARE